MSGAIHTLKKSSASANLSAVLDSLFAFGTRLGSGVSTASTDSVVCTPSGGTPPYTYLWAYVSGATNISIATPTGSSTYFFGSGAPTSSRSAVFKCTVTDAVSGSIIATPTVSVTLNWESLL